LLKGSKAQASLSAAQKAHCEESASDSGHWNGIRHLSPPGHRLPSIFSLLGLEVITVGGVFSETSWLSPRSLQGAAAQTTQTSPAVATQHVLLSQDPATAAQ